MITPADAEAALEHQHLALAPGDAVLFHTGWGRYWGVDNDAYVAGEPGPGLALGQWLVDHRVALTGCDTWSFGPVPPEDPADLAAHSLDFWLTTEDLPLWDNRVERGADGRIRLHCTPTNLEAHSRLNARFRSLLDAMQCQEEVLHRQTYVGGRLGISGTAHQNGTVRFGPDPATSALDLDCRMHDLDNLYVVDSSFFVSSTAMNPTLTIIANALRVGAHLAERLG